MFSFFRSKPPAPATFAFLGTDMHSHILPGIDDGAPDVATSIALIRALQDMGYQRLIATPHIYKELYPNTRETIENAYQQLHTALQAENIQIPVSYAAEYFLDEHFEELYKKGELLTLPGNYLLIEMSFMAPYPRLHELIFELCISGYKPILAHPERYLYLDTHKDTFEQIRGYGCSLQPNLLSFTGYYGKKTQKLAQWLLEHDLIDFLGTDLHHERHQQQLTLLLSDHKLVKKLEATSAFNHTLATAS